MVWCGEGGFGRRGIPNSPECRKKLSLAHKGIPKTEEHNLKNSLALKGKTKTAEHCINLSESNSKLTKQQVLDIREMYSKGGIRQKDIATMFNVSRECIGMIVRRKVWKHI
jgi:DNA-binding transcriptional regulator YiaG